MQKRILLKKKKNHLGNFFLAEEQKNFQNGAQKRRDKSGEVC